MYFFNREVLSLKRDKAVLLVAKSINEHCKVLMEDIIVQREIVRKTNGIIDKYEKYKKSMHRETARQYENERIFIAILNEKFSVECNRSFHSKKPKLENLKCGMINPENDQESEKMPRMAFSECTNKLSKVEVNINEDMSSIKDVDYETTLSFYERSKLLHKKPTVVETIINNPEIASILDRTGISTPQFTLLCGAISNVVGENESVLSTATIRRKRAKHRNMISNSIKNKFLTSITSALVVHWDGKYLKDETNVNKACRNSNIERISIMVSGLNIDKIISIPKIENGTGQTISNVVFNSLAEMNLLDKIIATCTDTTSINTGKYNGSVILFQKKLNRNLLYFPCRHHILELVIGSVFIDLFGSSSSPSPPLFENFKRKWQNINQLSFAVSYMLLYLLYLH